MKEAKEIAKELSKGNVKKAAEIRTQLLRIEGESFEMELTEIAKQAMLNQLKKGNIKAAKEIEGSFDIPESMAEDTIQQAVMSSFREGNVMLIKELKDDLPIPNELRVKIVQYCASWGKKDMTELMQTVFA